MMFYITMSQLLLFMFCADRQLSGPFRTWNRVTAAVGLAIVVLVATGIVK